MDYLKTVVPENIDRPTVEKILHDSLDETDRFCRQSRKRLSELGLSSETVLSLLALHKSFVKYGYLISQDSILQLFELSKKKKDHPLSRLLESPFLLAKACWVYEHAPYFYYFDKEKNENRNNLIYNFAETYDRDFLQNTVDITGWKSMADPWRIMMTTFWERKLIHPLLFIEKACTDNIEGIELNFDFHPFNYAKLLPEEVSEEQRNSIRESVARTGVKVDIHSPIVGPYVPSPDPAKGNQSFFNPINCFQVQRDTIELAKDIGAGCVTVHMVNVSKLKEMAELIETAAGSDVRVTVENYCQTKHRQNGDTVIECLAEICRMLPQEVKEKNFGVTLDVGHLNIEGDDPLVGSEKIGKWCLENNVFMRVHATDNYGDLLFSPPAFSADVHGNVSGRGINNAIIIKMLRSLGLRFSVVAEQIQPLTPEDVATIHEAMTHPIDHSYEEYCGIGKKKLIEADLGPFIDREIIETSPYQFMTGIEDTNALKEHLLYRKIQRNKLLSVEEAKKISQEFIRMPMKLRSDLTNYIDDFLSLIQLESGSIKKSDIDLVCQNISGAMFGAISNEHLNQIFSQERVCRKGDIICEQNSRGEEMYFVKKGEVIVSIDRSCVASLGPGEIFGEMSLFYNIERSATVIALKDETIVGILSRAELEALFQNCLPYSYDLIFRFFNILPGRLRNLNDKYKTAIHALHLIFDGNENAMPDLETIRMGLEKKQIDFLSELSLDDARDIFPDVRSIPAGRKVFSEGDVGDGAYFILDGKLKVVTHSASEEIVLGELSTGEIFGEMALIDDKPRSAAVVSESAATLGFISKKEFNELIDTKSKLAFRMMGFICRLLFRSILRLDRLYSDLKKKIYFAGRKS
jgi:CRP/FNR family transcriptional regulator, cyclic AMP receptor protein